MTARFDNDADWTSGLGQPPAKLTDNLGTEATIVRAWQVGRSVASKAILLRFAGIGIFALSTIQANEIGDALRKEGAKLTTSTP
jgi:hypothetical protein